LDENPKRGPKFKCSPQIDVSGDEAGANMGKQHAGENGQKQVKQPQSDVESNLTNAP
jgi:hypothetical protein